jgi:hypothetical protein
MTVTAPVKLTLPLAHLADIALRKFLSLSERFEKEATDLGKDSLATQIKEEREGLSENTLDKIAAARQQALGTDEPFDLELTPVEWRAIQAGIPKLIRDLRSAKGMARSNGFHGWIQELEDTAVLVETELRPLFQDQTEMDLENGAPALTIGDAEPKEEPKKKGKE